jgi:hypothetical protein
MTPHQLLFTRVLPVASYIAIGWTLATMITCLVQAARRRIASHPWFKVQVYCGLLAAIVGLQAASLTGALPYRVFLDITSWPALLAMAVFSVIFDRLGVGHRPGEGGAE